MIVLAIHLLLAIFQDLPVQLLKIGHIRQGCQKGPLRLLHQILDMPLVVASGQMAKLALEQVPVVKFQKPNNQLSDPALPNLDHSRPQIVLSRSLGNPAKESKSPNMTVKRGFNVRPFIGTNKYPMAMKQLQAK